MKITVELDVPNEVFNEHGRPKLIFERSWTFEGPVIMKPRTIWFMNALQDLIREYSRRESGNLKIERKDNGID